MQGDLEMNILRSESFRKNLAHNFRNVANAGRGLQNIQEPQVIFTCFFKDPNTPLSRGCCLCEIERGKKLKQHLRGN